MCHWRALIRRSSRFLCTPWQYRFFLVDGVIFANKSNEIPRLNYSNHVLRSARRLLVLGHIQRVLSLVRFLFESGGFFSEKVVVGASLPDVLKAIYSSKVSNQMYFLLSLFFIRIFAPIWSRLTIIPIWVIFLIWGGYTFVSSFFYHQFSQYFSQGLILCCTP